MKFIKTTAAAAETVINKSANAVTTIADGVARSALYLNQAITEELIEQYGKTITIDDNGNFVEDIDAIRAILAAKKNPQPTDDTTGNK